MHADSAFYIGKTHTVCEDYVTTYTKTGTTQVVLCDGCSSSKMVDVGARLLALTAAHLIEVMPSFSEDFFKFIAYELKTKYYMDFLRHNPTMFDATLLAAKVVGDKCYLAAKGDGILVVKYKSEEQPLLIRIEENNFPKYLSYSMDPAREAQYDAANDHAPKVITMTRLSGETQYTENIDKSRMFTMTIPMGDAEYVALFSDGVESYRDADRKSIDYHIILKELLNFKNYAGQFAARSLNGFRKRCIERGWTHDDDVSIGALYLGDYEANK